jgi:hypothetical protein
MSLQQIVLLDDAQGLDLPNKQKLERHVQKLVKAIQVSAVEKIFLEEQIQLLTTVNNEAKVRRSTQSLILGKGAGKVMSYEDLVAARAKRAEKERTKETQGKGSRGRKRKAPTLVASESSDKVARVGNEPTLVTVSTAQMTTAPDVNNETNFEPCRAPVPRMV